MTSEDPWDGSRPMEDAAVAYVRLQQWPVIPLWWPEEDGTCACPRGRACASSGKHPILMDWPSRATTDAPTVRALWTRFPRANIGVVTGQESIVVLDEDRGHGGALSLEDLVAAHGPLPDGPVVLTGGGGTHRFFRAGRPPLRNRTGMLPGLDFRADRGMVVAPPSRHRTGGIYRWEALHHPLDAAVPELPAWLEDLVRQSPGVKYGGRTPTKREWLDAIATDGASEGSRNDTLTRLMGHLLGHRVDARIATLALAGINEVICDPPLPRQEVLRIAASIANQERRREGAPHA